MTMRGTEWQPRGAVLLDAFAESDCPLSNRGSITLAAGSATPGSLTMGGVLTGGAGHRSEDKRTLPSITPSSPYTLVELAPM